MSAARPHGNPRYAGTPWLSWFCVWQVDSVLAVSKRDLEVLRELIESCPGLHAAHTLLPADAHDPYYPAPPGSPSLIVQLEFADLVALEENLQPNRHLAPLADVDFLKSLAAAWPTQQAMLSRRYPVADPQIRRPAAPYLSYWVEYAGPADDPNAWHSHYNRHHPQLLAGFPGIRAIEVYTPAIVVCGLPLPERPCLQRNKTVFDDVAAFNAAMKSPVREALREDFQQLPAFRGAALHFPFSTRSTRPAQPAPA